MAAATSPTLNNLRAQVSAIRKSAVDAKVFAISSAGRWIGPTDNIVSGQYIRVYQCDSPLQMRLALQQANQNADTTVLVTPPDSPALSDDILARVALRKVVPLNAWQIVLSLFNAKTVDPRIARDNFLADLLLEYADGDFPPATSGLLDAETVWNILLRNCLALPNSNPDIRDILHAAAANNLAARWQAATPEFRAAAARWIAQTAGDTASIILTSLATTHGAHVLAIGLVIEVVYHDAIGSQLDKAAGRLEAYAGISHLSLSDARQWQTAALSALPDISASAAQKSIEDAQNILIQIGAGDHAWLSANLDSALEQRLSRLARAITAHVDARSTTLSDELCNLYNAVFEHRLARQPDRRFERVQMAIRLARWLANQLVAAPTTSMPLVDLARQYASDGGFVDWARQVLRGGEPNPELAAAFTRLVNRVTDFRQLQNQRFAAALNECSTPGSSDSGLIPVENILTQIVAPAARAAPILLLLLDAMSWAVFQELRTDLQLHHWYEYGIEPHRPIGLSALPSVTEVCRTSLFCGSLRRGQAADEVHGFATHPALLAQSKPAHPPRLFHKAALQGDEDSSLASDIRAAISNDNQRLVGIVINAIDDHLDKGDQTDAIWTMQYIRTLAPILAAARDAERLVILLSDHGHILDRQTELCPAEDGLRWRRPGTPLINGEIEIQSPRVLLPPSGRVVLPWSETLRYGPKKNGYHGGATPQEMLTPISFLWSQPTPPQALVELSQADVPSWWTEPTVAIAVSAPAATNRPPPQTTPVAAPTLFDSPPIPVAHPQTPQPEAPWIAALLECQLFKTQKLRTARANIADAIVRAFLAALFNRGGTMTTQALAAAINVPEYRLPGLLAGLQRLLNIEAYAIIERDPVASTVKLNVDLLKKQFELAS